LDIDPQNQINNNKEVEKLKIQAFNNTEIEDPEDLK